VTTVTICLVSDRRRLVPADSPPDVSRRCLVAQARHACSAGVDLIQVRERDLDAAELVRLVGEVLAVTRGTPTRVVVNDRLDVALACGAHGVHLRADSVPVEVARRLVPSGFLIGCSVHGVDEAMRAGGADYLIAGTVFATASKLAGQPLLGADGLRSIVSVSDVPVLAIGGITEDCIDQIAAAGAMGFAAIGLFIAPRSADRGIEEAVCRAIPLDGVVERARARFDRVLRAP
jgi:thiamine-phosphate pyrophosphorylase